MKGREKRDASRRMKGRYSSRLSNKGGGKSHRTFRTAPEFFRLAVESLSEYALLTTDRNLTISSWSGPAAAMFGYEESEIIGRKISLLFTPEDVARGTDRSEFEKALEHGREDDERWHVRKDGQRLWCYGLSFPLKDAKGGVQGFVKLIRDDSERKAKDDLLRASEERLRLAVESTGLGTWDYDVLKGALMMSARAAELFGLGKDVRQAGFKQFVQMVHAEDREKVARDFDLCMAAGGSRETEMEYRVRMPDGRVRWVRTLARSFFNGAASGDAPMRLLGTVIDITDARKKQREAEDHNQELERRVKERTARLMALNQELESFAYSASHDLRAPLRKIAAFSQVVQKSAREKLSAEEQGYFDRIRANAAQMLRLIDDMLNLARVTRMPIKRADCDLSAMANEIAQDLRAAAPDRRVEFVITSGAQAEGDRELLAIALRNLLGNAWKFTGKHPTARIEFGVKTIEDRRVYFVKDDGAGFDMQFAHKLFAAFQRLHSEDQFPGTGVGLGMVERIVKRHRGRIWAESRVEEGATFFFTLYSEDE